MTHLTHIYMQPCLHSTFSHVYFPDRANCGNTEAQRSAISLISHTWQRPLPEWDCLCKPCVDFWGHNCAQTIISNFPVCSLGLSHWTYPAGILLYTSTMSIPNSRCKVIFPKDAQVAFLLDHLLHSLWDSVTFIPQLDLIGRISCPDYRRPRFPPLYRRPAAYGFKSPKWIHVWIHTLHTT